VRDPAIWFDAVSLALLAKLARHVPELRDRLHAARPTENGQDGFRRAAPIQQTYGRPSWRIVIAVEQPIARVGDVFRDCLYHRALSSAELPVLASTSHDKV
jgi:hypothetical protein